MRPQHGFLRRLSSVSNFNVPKHSGLFDLHFDPYQSIKSALAPAFSDLVVVLLSFLHIASYAYFIRSVFGLSSLECVNIVNFFEKTLPGAILIQVLWSAKSIYLLDKAVLDEHQPGNYLVRLFRSTLLTLPFSYIPSWIIGCVCWPFIPIRLYGDGKFYDHSIVIGHYVQLSLLYVGARNDSISNNMSAFCDIANTSRSRYWDIFEEAAQINILLMLAIAGLCGLGYYILPLNLDSLERIADMGVSADGFWLFVFVLLSCLVINIVHTAAIAATSILEFSRTTRQVLLEEELPVARTFQWAKFLPHMSIGIFVLVATVTFLVPDLLNRSCNKPPIRFEAPFHTSSPTTTP